MAVPITDVGLSSIQTEFGGTDPIALSEYYRGGAYIPTTQGDGGYGVVAPSGSISMGNFRNQQHAFQLPMTFTANSLNYNVRTAAIAAGWDQILPLVATVTVNPGVVIGSSSNAVPAFDTGTLPAGSMCYLTIGAGAYIVGKGGDGGRGGGDYNFGPCTPGAAGGTAIRAQVPVVIINGGTIGGGGGGGGGGQSSYFTQITYLGGGNNGQGQPTEQTFGICGGGGGGGAGYIGGYCNINGDGNNMWYDIGGGGKVTGGNGTLTAGGGNGHGASNYAGAYAGNGGSGGALGQPGITGAAGVQDYLGTFYPTSVGALGGAAGAAVVGNSNITWTTSGTILGALT